MSRDSMLRYLPLLLVIAFIPIGAALRFAQPFWGGLLFGVGILGATTGIYDLLQKNHAV